VIRRLNGLEPHYRQFSQGADKSLNTNRLLSHFASSTDGIGFRRAEKHTVASRYAEELAFKNGYQQRSNLMKLENRLAANWLAQPRKKNGGEFSVEFVGYWVEQKCWHLYRRDN